MDTSVSSAFYGPLQTVEVTLRNSVDGAISATHGERWFDNPTLLRPSDHRMVGDVVQRIYDAGKQPARRERWRSPFRPDSQVHRSIRLFAPETPDRASLLGT
ncbi:MAG: hypothetical protein NVS3B21_36010 [Acidimicrobiales bacterium]